MSYCRTLFRRWYRLLLVPAAIYLCLIFTYHQDKSMLSADSSIPTALASQPASSDSGLLMQVRNSSSSKLFPRRPETIDIDCGRVLRGDKKYIKEISSNRRTFVDAPLAMDCESILERIVPPVEMKPTNFGIAFARVVFRDYEFIEQEIKAAYHPENHFCFAVDNKSHVDFHSRMKILANCMPNIYIANESYAIDRSGHYMNHAHYSCLKELMQKDGWQYTIELQNHDVLMKSPYEVAEIYSSLGGANDIEIRKPMEKRYNKSLDWDPRKLHLFKIEMLTTPPQLTTRLHFAKGSVAAALSRDAVEWMVDIVDLTPLMDNFNRGSYGIDEMLLSSLQTTDEWDMPGRFTKKCIDNATNTNFITRLAHWRKKKSDCATGVIRHSICLLGLEDVPSIAQYPEVFANKFLPEFDYGGLECVRELIFNRTHLGQKDQQLNLKFYKNMPNVKYHKHRTRNPKFTNVDCRNSIWYKKIRYP